MPMALGTGRPRGSVSTQRKFAPLNDTGLPAQARGIQMVFGLFGPISSLQTLRRVAGIFANGPARARTLTTILIAVIAAGHPARAASPDDVDRILGAVSAS